MNFRFVFACALLLLIPQVSVAAQETLFDLRDPIERQQWHAQPESLSASTLPEDQGMRLLSEGPAFVLRSVADVGSFDVLRVTYSSNQPWQANFVWRLAGMDQDVFIETPVDLPANPGAATFAINTESFERWTGSAEVMGFSFPAGVHVILHQVYVVEYSLTEKALQAFKTFWKMDSFRPYTINMVWGPQIFSIPFSYSILFEGLPPPIKTVNRFFYMLLIFGLIFIILTRLQPLRRWREWAIGGTFLVLCTCWLVLDLRMGSELLSYSYTDYQQYIAPTENRKLFRDRGQFDVFMRQAIELVDEDQYVFLSEENWPYLGNARYLTYPVRPVLHNTVADSPRTWIVYEHTNTGLTDDGRLTVDGVPISPPGKIVRNFRANAFVFQLDQ